MFDAEILWFREAKAKKIKSHIDSIQVSHLHVARHGSIARLNRNAQELLAQKETTNLYFAQGLWTQRFFVFARRGPNEGGSMYLTCDRLNEERNKAKTQKIKSKGVFWVIWSSD